MSFWFGYHTSRNPVKYRAATILYYFHYIFSLEPLWQRKDETPGGPSAVPINQDLGGAGKVAIIAGRTCVLSTERKIQAAELRSLASVSPASVWIWA